MNNKKKILFFSTLFILLIILAIPTIRVFSLKFFGDYMGNPVSSESGCDLSTHHVEYIENSNRQHCVPNEDNS